MREPVPTYHWKNEWAMDDENLSQGPFWVDDRGEQFYPLGEPNEVWVTYQEAYDYARANGAKLVVE